MKKTNFILFVSGVLVAVLFIGGIIGYYLPHKKVVQTVDTSTGSNSSIPIGSVDNTPTFTTIDLNGNGQQATKKVSLPAGGYRITITNDNTDHFDVWLVDANGKDVDLLYNNSDSTVNTSKIENVTGGNYFFNVTSTGSWTIKVEAI